MESCSSRRRPSSVIIDAKSTFQPMGRSPRWFRNTTPAYFISLPSNDDYFIKHLLLKIILTMMKTEASVMT